MSKLVPIPPFGLFVREQDYDKALREQMWMLVAGAVACAAIGVYAVVMLIFG